MDWVTLIILAWVCIAIGYFGANLVNNYRGRRRDKTLPDQDTETDGLDRKEIVRLWRGNDKGEFMAEIDGEVIAKARHLKPDQHARISMAVVDLYDWMEKGNQEPPTILKPQPEAHASAASVSKTGSDGREPEEMDLLEEQDGPKPASMNFLKSLVHTAQTEINQKVAPEGQSIAAQVDEILQEKIGGTPFENRAIRLMDLPNQGMVIFIGLDKYDSLDQVPDEEIREILVASVNEWEEKMLGGKKKNVGDNSE